MIARAFMLRIIVQLAFRRRSLGHLTVIRATESLALELAVSFDLARSRALAVSRPPILARCSTLRPFIVR